MAGRVTHTAKKVVILGGGFAGLTLFHHLSKWARPDEVALTVIDERETFLVKPSLLEVALGEKGIGDITFPLRPVVEAHGQFIRSRIHRIDPHTRIVHLDDEATIGYDLLVISTGAKKDFALTTGFKDYGYSVCTDILAPRLHDAIERFEEGNILIGSEPIPSGTRVKDAPRLATACEGPVGEMAFMIDSALRRRGIRDKAHIICFSPAEIFFEDVGGKVHEAFGALAADHQLEVITNKAIASIEREQVRFKDGTTVPSALTILIPIYRGPDVVLESGLGDEAGFVPTDESFQHLDFPDIYALGDVASRTVPKLGHLAVEQATLVASIIRRRLTGKGERYNYEPEIFCIMSMGPHDATLIRSNVMWGGEMDLAYHGSLSHLMKSTFDAYTVKFKGKMPPQLAQQMLNLYLGKFQK